MVMTALEAENDVAELTRLRPGSSGGAEATMALDPTAGRREHREIGAATP